MWIRFEGTFDTIFQRLVSTATECEYEPSRDGPTTHSVMVRIPDEWVQPGDQHLFLVHHLAPYATVDWVAVFDNQEELDDHFDSLADLDIFEECSVIDTSEILRM